MNLGQFFSGAGQASAGIRQAEEAERVARQNQLAIEEQNRQADELRRLATMRQAPPTVLPTPDFGNLVASPAGLTLPQTQTFPTEVVPPVSAPTAPAPAAPAAPAPAAPAALAAPAMRPAAVEQYQLGAMTVSPAPVVSAPTAARLTQNASEMIRMREMRVKDVQAGLDRLIAGNAPARMIENQKQLLAREQQLLETSRRGIERVEEGRQRGEQLAAQQAAAQREANVQGAEQQGILPWQLNDKGQPIRGLVNNNPGNIRPDARYQWEGAVGVDKGEKEKAGFVQFATPEAGIRALTMNLMSYDAQGINTPRAIINRWAPPSDQPGKSNANYIAAVAKALGVKPTDTINVKDPAVMQQLVASIIEFENGKQPYAPNVLMAGVTAGLNRQSLATPGATPAAPSLPSLPPAAAAPATPTAGITIPGAAPAAAPAAAQPAAAQPAAAPVVRVDADFYLANREAIPYEQQRLNEEFRFVASQAQERAALLTQQRNQAARLQQIYGSSGTRTGQQAAERLQQDIDKYDIALLEVRQQTAQARQKVEQGRTYLEGMQGIQEFALANDPRRLASVWSLYAGVPIGIQPRSDGKFNIMVNGRKTKEGISADELINSARLAFDQTYRQQQAAAGAKLKEFMTQEQFKAMLEIQKGNATEMAKMIGDIARERVKGNNAQALEWAKANYGWDIKPTGAGDGTVIIRAPGSPPYVFNPSSGATVSPDGVTIPAGGARVIPGLPTPAGQTAALPTR